MIHYVLKNGRGTLYYRTEILTNIVDMLECVESKDGDLDDFTVIEIDTDNLPPVYKTAREFLRSARGKA